MSKTALALAVLGISAMLPIVPNVHAQSGKNAFDAPLPSQILTAKKVFISNAGGIFDTNMVSGEPRRDYNQFYAAIKSWGRYELVGSPAEADLILQISLTSIPRQMGSEMVPFPTFKLGLLDPKTNVTLWALDVFLVDRPGFSMILKKNRDKAFDEAVAKLVDDLKALTAEPANPAK